MLNESGYTIACACGCLSPEYVFRPVNLTVAPYGVVVYVNVKLGEWGWGCVREKKLGKKRRSPRFWICVEMSAMRVSLGG